MTTTIDLITPEEAANIMSRRAGYKITSDDLKQLRRYGRVKAAKQSTRMTLYERSEIENAPLPKKHNPEKLELEDQAAKLDGEQAGKSRIVDIELAIRIEVQKVELEKQRALFEQEREQHQIEIERQRLFLQQEHLKRLEHAIEVANKMIDILRPDADATTKSVLARALLPNLLQLGYANNTKGLEQAVLSACQDAGYEAQTLSLSSSPSS